MTMLSIFFIVLSSKYSFSASGWTNGDDNDAEKRSTPQLPLIRRDKNQNNEDSPASNSDGYGQRSLKQNAANFNEIQKRHDSTINQYKVEKDKIQGKLNGLKKDLEPLEKEAKQDYWENFGGKLGGWFGTTPRDQTASKAKNSQSKLDNINIDIDKANSDLQFKSDLIEKQEREYLEQKKNTKSMDAKVLDEIQILKNHIQRSDALREFSKLKIEALTDQDKLDIIEKEVDKSTIGNYIQVKLGKFMNSRSFCSAAEQCSGRNRKEKANVSQGDFTNEIFGNRTIGPNDQNINDNAIK